MLNVESALKQSMIHIAAKLNYKNLNEEVLKQFARLQSKDEQVYGNTCIIISASVVYCMLDFQVLTVLLSWSSQLLPIFLLFIIFKN